MAKEISLTGEQTAILTMKAKRHQKIYLLKRTGMRNIDIARTLQTNGGHVGNVLKEYDAKPDRCENALALLQLK